MSSKEISKAAVDHESAAMNKGNTPTSSSPPKQPALPVNTGNGWRKGAGTDMI